MDQTSGPSVISFCFLHVPPDGLHIGLRGPNNVPRISIVKTAIVDPYMWTSLNKGGGGTFELNSGHERNAKATLTLIKQKPSSEEVNWKAFPPKDLNGPLPDNLVLMNDLNDQDNEQ